MNKLSWQTKKLDDVCFVEYGTRVVNKRDGGTVYPVYGGGGATFFMDEYNRENQMVIARFAMSAQCTRFVTGKFFLNDSGLTIKPKNSKEIDQVFLDYQTLYLNDILYALAKGSAQKNLDVPAFRKLDISFPDTITEQKRIVKILDETFEKIAKAKENAEKNLQNSKELFESYLQNVFADTSERWEEKTLEDVCEIVSKLVDPKKSDYRDLYHVGAGNMITSSEKLIDLKTAKDEGLISGKFLFDTSMVLYSKIRPYLMKVTRPDFNGLCSADIYPLKPKSEIMTQGFLYYLLVSKDFTDYAIKGSARAGMPKVNREHLFAYSFNLPPLTEQILFVKKLDSLSEQTKKLESNYKQKIVDLNELKKSLLTKAFAGEL